MFFFKKEILIFCGYFFINFTFSNPPSNVTINIGNEVNSGDEKNKYEFLKI